MNSAPTDIALSNDTVEENEPTGTTVGALSTTITDIEGFSISDVTLAEGDSGKTAFVFTSTRTGDVSEVSKTVTVKVIGDKKVEPDETFTVVLSRPSATITNDDP